MGPSCVCGIARESSSRESRDFRTEISAYRADRHYALRVSWWSILTTGAALSSTCSPLAWRTFTKYQARSPIYRKGTCCPSLISAAFSSNPIWYFLCKRAILQLKTSLTMLLILTALYLLFWRYFITKQSQFGSVSKAGGAEAKIKRDTSPASSDLCLNPIGTSLVVKPSAENMEPHCLLKVTVQWSSQWYLPDLQRCNNIDLPSWLFPFAD